MKFEDFNYNYFSDVRNITHIDKLPQFITYSDANQIVMQFPDGISVQIGHHNLNMSDSILENVYSIHINEKNIVCLNENKELLCAFNRENHIILDNAINTAEILLILQPVDRFLLARYLCQMDKMENGKYPALYPDIIPSIVYSPIRNMYLLEVYTRLNPYSPLSLIFAEENFSTLYLTEILSRYQHALSYVISKFNEELIPIVEGDYLCFEKGAHIYKIDKINLTDLVLSPVYRPLDKSSKSEPITISFIEAMKTSIHYSSDVVFIFDKICICDHKVILMDTEEFNKESPILYLDKILEIFDKIGSLSIETKEDAIASASEALSLINKINECLSKLNRFKGKHDIITMKDNSFINISQTIDQLQQQTDKAKDFIKLFNL